MLKIRTFFVSSKSFFRSLNQISGAAAAESFKADNDVVIVAFQEDATVFVGAADQVDDYKFGLLDADAAAALGVEQGQIVLFKVKLQRGYL